MKSIFRSLVLAALLVSAASYAGDGSTPVTQVGNRADATFTANATAAVNTVVTLTIGAGPGCIYVTEIDFTASEDGTGGTDSFTNLSFTTTGLGGWKYTFSAATAAANTTPVDKSFAFPLPLKGQPATAVTIVSPAVKTHTIYNINAAYYYAPCS